MALPDIATRAATRVLAVYNLAGPLHVERTLPLTSGFDMGRFADHIESAARLLPQVTDRLVIDPADFRTSADDTAVRVRTVTALLATTPRRDGLLLLDIKLAGEPTAAAVADFLYATWHERERLRVGDTPLLDWIGSRLATGDTPLAFGRNVHQCVFMGGRVARRILRGNRRSRTASPEVVTVVFRGTIAAKRGTGLDIRRPATLNNPGQTLVAHGRGVSLVIGWTEAVENAFIAAAAGLVNAAGVVHRVRRESLEALEANESAAFASVPELRDLITGLSAQLNEMQLDLSFGIEAYADTTLIPEMLIESYHSSLRSVAGLAESLRNTSRIVDRVAAAIESRRVLLDAATADFTERRARIFGSAVAVGSLLALPAAILLAYFGVNSTDVDDHRSIFDLHRYGVVYLAVWLPFVALVVTTVIMRRRVRLRLREPGDPLTGPSYAGPPGRRRDRSAR